MSGRGGPVEVHFENLRQFSAVAEALGDAGKDLKKELRKGLNKAVKPLGVKAKQNIPRYVPSGYAPVLQRAFRASTSVRLSGNPKVTLTGQAKGKRKKREVRAIDAGILRHPVFGNRDAWVAQKIRKGFWSDPVREAGPAVKAEAITVIQDMHRTIIRRATASG